MRVVIQRVKSASVEVGGTKVSKIGPGLLCLVGIKAGDTDKDADFICKKILRCRAFGDEETGRPWTDDVVSKGYEVLLVSQFTLYGRLKKPRPDYSKAMPPEEAQEVYSRFVQQIRSAYEPEKVQDGVFGAMMDVSLVNDGPVTFIVDSNDGPV